MRTLASTPRIAAAALLLALGALSPPTACAQQAPASAGAAAESARPAVFHALQAAQALINEGRHADALAKLREAEAMAGLNPYEKFFIERTRGAAALGAGDLSLAARSLESALASGRLHGEEQRDVLKALADIQYRSKEYPQAAATAQRYVKEGGSDAAMRPLLVNALYLGGNHAAVARELATDVKADEAAGRVPPEQALRMLASAQAQVKDDAGYAATLEKLAVRYPKPEIWNDLISRVQASPGFDDRLRLDAYRLRLAAGILARGGEYAEMAQLALQAGYPAEAQRVIEAGHAKGLLGTGPNAKVHQQLREQARRQAAADAPQLAQSAASAAARDGNVMVTVGYALVTAGQADKGVPLMERGLAKSGIRRPEDARLHLGVAQLIAGHKDAAVKTLKAVQGSDGTADLARLWALLAQAPGAVVSQ